MAQSELLKVAKRIAEYALIGEAAATGITALLKLIDNFENAEVSIEDIDREIATTKERIKEANGRDEARLSSGT